MTAFVHAFLSALGLYLGAGVAFAVPFVLVGVSRVDATARVATWGFRVIIVPGVVALWPLLAWRWATGHAPVERNVHRDLACDGNGKAAP